MKRVALVIGNAAYRDRPLTNPCNDAEDMAAVLRRFEFTVLECMDGTHKAMEQKLRDFREAMYDADVGLFFFAGHGLQIEGSNYLLATDTSTGDEVDVKHSSLSLDYVIDSMEKSQTLINLIILDACRQNLWERRWERSSTTRGLASVYVPKGTLIAFATSPGQVAYDGKGQRNGRYTSALLQHIIAPDCTIEAMFKRVRNTLSVTTEGKQISWEHTSLSSEFFFNRSVGVRIKTYSPSALRDALLELDDSFESHKIIRDLKSHSWYGQNPALKRLTPESARKFHKDNLFVLGRNIYQAACGHAFEATSLIQNFTSRMRELPEPKRKALLDGMLFEVFFDSNGDLREAPKDRFFTELFDLQRYESTAQSFEFIAQCLLPYASRFHTVPGKSREVSVDIVLQARESSKHPYVTRVCIASVNLLNRIEHPEHVDEEDDEQGPERYNPTSRTEFEERIAKQLLIPSHLLSFTYTGTSGKPKRVNSPTGWSVRKGAD